MRRYARLPCGACAAWRSLGVALALAVVLVLSLARSARIAIAQVPRPERRVVGPLFFYGAAAVVQTRFLADGNGTTVTGKPTIAGEGGFTWGWDERGALAPRWQLGVQLRGAFPAVRIVESPGVGRDRDAGRARMVDLVLRLDRRFGDSRVHVAGGAAWLDGPADVAPFRFAGVDGLSGTGEVGLARLIHGDYVWATATGQLTHLDAASAASRFRGGAVARLLLGVRLAP